jgi:tetratricopeptide (TPR) repeat protein
VVRDPFYAAAIAGVPEATSIVAMADLGRLLAVAAAFETGDDADEMRPMAQLLSGTLLSFGVEQSGTRLALRVRVRGLPDVSPLVARLVQEQHAHRGAIEAASATSRPGQDDLPALFARFERAARDPAQRDEALTLGRAVLDQADATRLNNVAWALLTEDRYGRRFDELALVLSERSNEKSADGNWMFLDTLALANFHLGRLDEAIRLEERALELVGDDESTFGLHHG